MKRGIWRSDKYLFPEQCWAPVVPFELVFFQIWAERLGKKEFFVTLWWSRVRYQVIFHDKGGKGGLTTPPPPKDYIICEQPLSRQTCKSTYRLKWPRGQCSFIPFFWDPEGYAINRHWKQWRWQRLDTDNKSSFFFLQEPESCWNSRTLFYSSMNFRGCHIVLEWILLLVGCITFCQINEWKQERSIKGRWRRDYRTIETYKAFPPLISLV